MRVVFAFSMKKLLFDKILDMSIRFFVGGYTEVLPHCFDWAGMRRMNQPKNLVGNGRHEHTTFRRYFTSGQDGEQDKGGQEVKHGHGHKPTHAQKVILSNAGLNHKDWLVIAELPAALELIRKDNRARCTLWKDGSSVLTQTKDGITLSRVAHYLFGK